VAAVLVRSSAYCARGGDVRPCPDGVPSGFRRIVGAGAPVNGQIEAVVSFRARIAVRNSDSHYEVAVRHPPSRLACGGGEVPTDENIAAGQLVHRWVFVEARCHGVFHVTVTYVADDGPSSSKPVPGLPGRGQGVLVGRTTFRN
jgi:hypothetical protein